MIWNSGYTADPTAPRRFPSPSAFEAVGSELRSLGEYRAPSAHTVSVDPRTHRVYLPLENVNGGPLLRVLSP